MSQEHKFLISMTVLDHLGRQLYRNFITVIGEAISNAWDADARNVWIELDRSTQTLSILDDGHGMSSKDLDDKFLKIGYTKRGREGTERHSAKGRPYIGAKGIGKLALLSCADAISIASKTTSTEPTGCLISNNELDRAITNDLTTEEVILGDAMPQAYNLLNKLPSNSGTALILNGMRTANSSDKFLRSSIAQGFRFSLIDKNFHIYYNGSEITYKDLSRLTERTQFAWVFPNTNDDFTQLLNDATKTTQNTDPDNKYTIPTISFTHNDSNGENRAQQQLITVTGFIATAIKPRDLQIYGSNERATLDLFVNGRMRERNIIQHIPSSRVPEQYIYGQIHVNGLDRPGTDPFTSAREQVIATDPVYQKVLQLLKDILNKIYDHWDRMRVKLNQESDTTSSQFDRDTRSAKSLASDTMQRILKSLSEEERTHWKSITDELTSRASTMSKYYTLIFLTETFLRKLLNDNGYQTQDSLPPFIQNKLYDFPYKGKDGMNRIAKTRAKEADLGYKGRASIRKIDSDLDYLEFRELLSFCDKGPNGLSFKEIAPELSNKVEHIVKLRNIIMHCCSFTSHGRKEFTTLYPKLHELLKAFASNAMRTYDSEISDQD
ncbi:MAG: ATP-binding protein [Schaalia sp.]|nr:ATP-binding protein [Schaalia odontolytica]